MQRKVLFHAVFVVMIVGCSQYTKDKGIKQMIATAAKEEIAFVGLNYSVANGVVTLSGNCATALERTKVESKVRQTSGVKEVRNLIAVSPIVLDGGHMLKRAADSVLMNYPSVNARVQDSIIYLEGELKEKEREKIMVSLQQLGAKGITNTSQISQY